MAGHLSHIPTILEYSLTKQHHGAEKPVELCSTLIKEFTLQGGVVLDIFMGSGSTGAAAIGLDRKFIGVELDENYFNIACGRILEAII